MTNTISLPFGAVRMEQSKANGDYYTIEADCSAAEASAPGLSLKKVEGSLETVPHRGGDKCNGKIELTLHDESKGVDITVPVKLSGGFFQQINIASSRGWVDYLHTQLMIVTGGDGEELVFRIEMSIDRCSQTGGYGKPLVFPMQMTIGLEELDVDKSDLDDIKERIEFEERMR